MVKSAQEQISQGDLPNDFIETSAKNLIYEKFDKRGWLEYTVSAIDVERFYNQDAKLITVSALFYTKNRQDNPWNITAGHVIFTDKNMHFYDNIVMLRKAKGENFPSIKITTEAFTYNDKDYLNTDQKVTISQPGTKNNTVGIGMIGEPKKGDFKLLKDVRSYYAEE